MEIAKVQIRDEGIEGEKRHTMQAMQCPPGTSEIPVQEDGALHAEPILQTQDDDDDEVPPLPMGVGVVLVR